MVERPTGTVTFLFSDIEGSTQRWERQREQMQRAFDRQEKIMRQAIAAHGGYAYKMIGDAFQVAFATAPAALAAALHAQRVLHAEPWGDTGPVRVRMALHTGITEERRDDQGHLDDYVGPLLNRVARLMSAGHGGQILLSRATEELVRDHLPAGASLRDLGEHQLKDIVRPERLFQLIVPDVPSDFPPLKTIEIQPSQIVVGEELPTPGEPPFKGLLYFDEDDADLFFGREQMTSQLVSHLSESKFLAVVGASGSGKSSVVRAGLIPVLKQNKRLEDGSRTPEGSAHWRVRVITPTAHPLEALAVNLTRDSESVTAATTLIDDLARDSRSLHLWVRKVLTLQLSPSKNEGRMLLVVDQFEELFTLCRNESERRAFIDNLITATAPELDGPTMVVITLRADFYAHCAQYANLRETLAKRQEYIGPMNEEELRRAIEEPAKRDGWTFEPGLVDLLLQDVGDEPGALPLLSHALLETWQRRRGRTLTFAGYNASGGVRGAIAKTAESVYQKSSPEQQAIARNIFLRLTELGEGTQDTRRRAAMSELIPPFADARAADEVLKLLADARLITTSEGYAEVAHEALIREWTRLREWLNENREGLRLHRHLTEAAQSWQKLNRDSGELYRGARLAQALEWAKANAGEINPLEREFLDASKQLLEQEEAEREAQRQRELIAARKLAEGERRRANILRSVAIGASVLLVVMIGLAVFAFSQRSEAENARVQVVAQRDAAQRAQLETAAQRDVAEKAKADAEYQRQIAFARELSVNAVSNLDIDPERSILLALQAISVSTAGGKPVLREAEEALHRAVMSSRVRMTVGHPNQVWDAAFSPDGKLIATSSSDQTAKIWDAATGKELLTLIGHTGRVPHVDFSPDGKRLVTASVDKSAKVWDVATGKALMTLQDDQEIWMVAYSPDGTRIATGCGNNSAKMWDAATGKLLFTLGCQVNGFNRIAFSPDGKRLVTPTVDGTAKIWDAETGKELLTLGNPGSSNVHVAFSPEGKRIATNLTGGLARVWDATSGRELLTLNVQHGEIVSIGFDLPFGTRLITGNIDGTTQIWDISSTRTQSADSTQVTSSTSGQLLFTLVGHTNTIRNARPSPDGMKLVTASDDYTARIWDISSSGTSEWLTIPNAAGYDKYTPDGKRLVGLDNTATRTKVWDAVNGQELLTISLGGGIFSQGGVISGYALSWDGKRYMSVTDGKIATVWELETGRQLVSVPTASVVDTGTYIYGVAFHPDGTRFATATGKGNITIWDVNSGKELMTLTGHTAGVNGLDYSPDGTLLASADSAVKIWDARSGKELRTFTASGTPRVFTGVRFSPDGTRLAAINTLPSAIVWDVATGKELQTFSGHTARLYSLAFSPDGTRLATGGDDSTVKIWNVSPGTEVREQLLTLYGFRGPVYGVTFSPDGKRLAVGDYLLGGKEGSALRVYALPLEDIVAIAKSRVTRALTTDECQKYLHVEQCP